MFVLPERFARFFTFFFEAISSFSNNSFGQGVCEHKLIQRVFKTLYLLSFFKLTLTVLDVSGNSLDEVSDLRDLRSIDVLRLKDNNINNWADLSECLFDWKRIRNLDLSGNPICMHKKFRDKLIIISKSLGKIEHGFTVICEAF